jgi:hypothetical protein
MGEFWAHGVAINVASPPTRVTWPVGDGLPDAGDIRNFDEPFLMMLRVEWACANFHRTAEDAPCGRQLCTAGKLRHAACQHCISKGCVLL